MVPPYDDYQVMAGAGTAILELMEEVPRPRRPASSAAAAAG
jgi:threonine dehydratase